MFCVLFLLLYCLTFYTCILCILSKFTPLPEISLPENSSLTAPTSCAVFFNPLSPLGGACVHIGVGTSPGAELASYVLHSCRKVTLPPPRSRSSDEVGLCAFFIHLCWDLIGLNLHKPCACWHKSYVRLPYNVWETLLHCLHPLSLVLPIFLTHFPHAPPLFLPPTPSFCNEPWTLGGQVIYKCPVEGWLSDLVLKRTAPPGKHGDLDFLLLPTA